MRTSSRQAECFRFSTGKLETVVVLAGAGTRPAGRVLRLSYHPPPHRVAGALVAPANCPSGSRFRMPGETQANVRGYNEKSGAWTKAVLA